MPGQRIEPPRSIWTVSNGPYGAPVGYFSTRVLADKYVEVVGERYKLGKALRISNGITSDDPEAWRVGFMLDSSECKLDLDLGSLPGNWLVKVDDAERIVSCTFSFIHRASREARIMRRGLENFSEAAGNTPQAAFEHARSALRSHLRDGNAWRR